MNDIQLVSLIAGSRWDISAADAVKWAGEIVLEAVAQNDDLMKAIKLRLSSPTK